jgi:hypothetical protein
LLVFAPLWLATPFLSGALLASSERARRIAARYYWNVLSLGWFGVALVLLGAFVLPRPLSLVALGVGGPLSGLSFWSRRQGEQDADDDDGPGGGGDEPGPPSPGGDWERIVRELERHVDRLGPSRPERPRAPERPRRNAPSPARI